VLCCVECSHWVRVESLPQAEEFKYPGILFTSDGLLEGETDRWIGASSTVIRTLCQSVVVMRKLSHKSKLFVYWYIFFLALTHGYEIWVVAERIGSVQFYLVT